MERRRLLIMHLGGERTRAVTTAWVAGQFRGADVLLSTPENARECRALLQSEGYVAQPITDFGGWDTVSQFTSAWRILRMLRIERLFIVTDVAHLPRAVRIARLAYLGRGVQIVGVPHLGSGLDHREPWRRVWLDATRALVWRVTGWLWYERRIRDARMPGIRALEADA